MTTVLLYLTLCVFISVYQSFLALVLFLYFLIFKSFKHKSLFIVLFVLFNLRLNLNTCQIINQAKVVELNDHSILVNHNLTNVLISVKDVSNYALGDRIILYQTQALNLSPHQYGFNVKNYYLSRNICFSAFEQDTYKIEGSGLFHWLSQGGFNPNERFKQFSRSILFQSNPNQSLDLFISMGLLYLSIIKVLELFFLKVKNRSIEIIIISFVLAIIGLNLAFPLSLIRVIIFYLSSKFISDRMQRFTLNCLICAFISPYGLTQLAFALPLLLQFSTLFFPLKSKYFQRICCLIVVFVAYNQSFSLFSLFLYPILMIVYRYIILFTLTSMFIPMFTHIYIVLIEYVNQIIQFSQSLFILKGHINFQFVLILIFIYHFYCSNKFSNLIILMSVLIGIPLTSLPLFYTVTLINVGQGDSILLQAPFNRTVILIDTGSSFQYKALKTYLNAQSIYTLDYLVISHDDSDHSSNTEILMKDYLVNECVMKGKDIQTNTLFLDYLDFNQSFNNDNDQSLIYYTNIYHKTFLFMGDLSTGGERKLIQQYPYLRTDFLKIGHHGSNTSTSDDFLKQIQARIALIGVGKNSYGHPSEDVLNRLNDYAIETFDTQLHGDIRIIVLPFISLILNSQNDVYIF